MNRRILVEMATYKESEVFAQEPVASASTKDVESLEDDKLREYVYNRIGNVGNTISEHDIGVLIKHHCGNRLRKKTALLTLPYVINANYIIHPWRRQTNNGEIIKGKDKRLSGMVGAPILIDGTKYLCNISLKKSANGKVRPYALTLKDGNGNIVENEKMDSTLQVPDSNSEPTTSGNAHFDKVTTSPDTNPSTNANIDKNNKTDINCSKNMNKKNTIRLTESELKRIITESVKRVLKENMGQQYRIDLKSNSRTNQQTISQLHTLLNSRKPMECTLNMFYGNGFTCDATFTTNGNSVCTINITSSTQYNKTFEYNTGNAVQQALNIGRNLCNQWLQTIQQKNQQPMQQQM